MTLAVAIATCCGVFSLTAQTTPERRDTQVWKLQGLRASYCVHFLIEPRMASRELRKGFILLRADQDKSLHTSLQHVIKSQPDFASWAASAICFYHADAVQLGRRLIVEKDRRKAQMLAVWSLATRETDGGARRDLVLDLYSARGTLARAAEKARVELHEAESRVSDPADTTSDLYSVKLGKTRLVWNGRPVGDSARVQEPLRASWSVAGKKGPWAADLAFSPAWSLPLAGSLKVEGKGDLAKALKASPIRFVGPFYRGGDAELRFFPPRSRD